MSKAIERSAPSTLVLKLSGQVDVQNAAVIDAVIHFLDQARRAGTRVVLVHGGAAIISHWMERYGIAPKFFEGLRITDDNSIEVVEMVLSATLNKAWVAALQRRGIPSAGFSGRDGGLLQAEVRPLGGATASVRVGRIRDVDPTLLFTLMEAGYVPVVSPISQDEQGRSLNVNADEAAAALAAAVHADALVLLTDVPGILSDPDQPDSLIRDLDPHRARQLLDGVSITAGMRPKLQSALSAIDNGVARIHFLDGTDPDAIMGAAEALFSPSERKLPGTTLTAETSTTAQWISRGQVVLMPTYARQPIVMRSGRGAQIEDVDGRRYLDFLSGLAVTSLGHGRSSLAQVLADQARTLIHCSNLFWIPQQIQLAERLCELSGMERWFFANSGTEANEAAIKLARKFGTTTKGPEAFEILTATQSFHGRTLGSLAATGQAHHQEGFGRMPEGFRHVPYGDVDAVRDAVGDRTCAVLVEPIQGEGGVHVPPEGYLSDLRRLCDERNILLIFDEIQTGFGRTGRWFAHQHEGVLPDVITLAKALANGVPIGAMGARGRAASVLGPGNHAATFGGNPLACAAALHVLDTMAAERLPDRAAALGARFFSRFQREMARPGSPIRDVRGRGLLLGIELTGGAGQIASRCRDRGLLVNAIGERILRLLPPLSISDEEFETGLEILAQTIRET